MEPSLSKHKGELTFLTSSVNNCFKKGWITENEMIEIENTADLNDKKMKIYELMKTKDEETALHLFYGVVRAESVPEGETVNAFREDENEILQKSNPMELGPIIKCVFEFLDVKDIKRCRYVCREWNRAAKPILRARAKVVIRQDNLVAKFRPIDCINSRFVQIFSEPPTVTDVPFTAFKIESGKQWLYAELNDFFQRQHTNIKELELGNIILGHSCEETAPEIESFDITRWIAESKISKPNSKYNTKLSVSSDSESVMFIMNSYNLVWVKELSLKGCRLNLQDGVRINPVKLSLSGVKYYWDGNRLPEIIVNDFLNFSKLKDIELTGSHLSINNKIILDVNTTYKVNLNSLTLNAVVVTNWKTSTWTVDTLNMTQTQLLMKMGMKVRKLSFKYATINISSLPETLTTLCIHEIGIRTKLAFPSGPIYLPNLKFMNLEMTCDGDNSFLLYFINCPSLVSLHLVKHAPLEKTPLELSWIPRNVKNLKLKGITISFQEYNNDLILDNLILDEYSLYEASNVHNIRSNNLVLNWIPNFDTNFKVFQFLENLIEEYDMYNVCVGPFDWRICPLKNSCLSHYMDKESQYYIFENLKGRAVDRNEFDKLMELQN